MREKLNYRAKFRIVTKDGLFFVKVILKIGAESEREIIITNHGFELESECRAFIKSAGKRIIAGIFERIGYTVEEGAKLSRSREALH